MGVAAPPIVLSPRAAKPFQEICMRINPLILTLLIRTEAIRINPRFLICNTWRHVPNRPQHIGLMKKMLKPGGQIVIIDYRKEKLPVGPPPEMKMAKEEVLREMESNGLKLAKEHTFLPYQYFLVFTARQCIYQIAVKHF
jgi:hypothetical protein